MSITVNKTRLPGSVIKTASGAVASASDARMRGAIGVEASFEPKQDLHGYANPWLAGGGKNLFDESTIYHGYYQPTSPSTLVSNEAYRTAIVELPAGTYTFATWLTDAYFLRYAVGDTNHSNSGAVIPYTFTVGSANTVRICFRKADSTVITESFHTQIEKGSTSTAWTPYENLCPISGITSASAWADPQYGGLVDWNQAIYNGNFADASRWVVAPANSGSLSISGNIATVTPLPDSNTYTSVYGTQYTGVYITSGHKYLHTAYMRTGVWPESGYQVIVTYGGYWIKTITAQMPVNEWVEISGVWNSPTSGNTTNPSIRKYKDANLTPFEVKEFMVFDLTQMFGATKADEIYALEVATPGAGVAYFKSLFPKAYYDYDLGGTLKTVSAVNGDPHNVTAQLGETRYGGTYDFVRGRLTLTGIVEVFNIVSDGIIKSQANSFNKNGGSVSTIGSYTRVSFAVITGEDQTQFNRVSSSYPANRRISNLARHYFAYNDESAHWYRNTVLYLYLPTALVGNTAQSVYDYLVSIKDATPFSVWMEMAKPIVIDMTPAEFELFHKQNFVWSDVGDTKLTYAAIHEHGG